MARRGSRRCHSAITSPIAPEPERSVSSCRVRRITCRMRVLSGVGASSTARVHGHDRERDHALNTDEYAAGHVCCAVRATVAQSARALDRNISQFLWIHVVRFRCADGRSISNRVRRFNDALRSAAVKDAARRFAGPPASLTATSLRGETALMAERGTARRARPDPSAAGRIPPGRAAV